MLRTPQNNPASYRFIHPSSGDLLWGFLGFHQISSLSIAAQQIPPAWDIISFLKGDDSTWQWPHGTTKKSSRLKIPTKHHWRLAVWVKIHIYPISISIWNRVFVQRCNWRISQQLGWIRHQLAGRIIPTGWLQGRCLLSTGHVLVDKQMVGGSDQWLAYSDPIDMPGIPHPVFPPIGDYPGSKQLKPWKSMKSQV